MRSCSQRWRVKQAFSSILLAGWPGQLFLLAHTGIGGKYRLGEFQIALFLHSSGRRKRDACRGGAFAGSLSRPSAR